MIYRVRVSPGLIESWVREGHVISARCVEGLPSGAALAHVSWRSERGARYVVLRFHVQDGDETSVSDFVPIYESLPVIRGASPVTRWDQREPA